MEHQCINKIERKKIQMKIKIFDVVELKDNNRAIILEIKGNKYFAEIVNTYGITVCKRKEISKKDIDKLINKKERTR